MSAPFSNKHFVEFCLKMVGQPYWYGTCIYPCTTSRYNSKKAQYPSHYTSSRASQYKKDIASHKVASDCIGGYKGYMWTNAGDKVIESIGKATPLFRNKYLSNNCPDKSANGMLSYIKSIGLQYGSICTLPDTIGLALWMDGHVGYTVGGGYAVEWRGFAYGCVKTKIKDRPWKTWSKLPGIVYEDIKITGNGELGSEILLVGSKGAGVKALQTALVSIGYTLPKYGIDSDYGKETSSAVSKFQSDNGLTSTGNYDLATHTKLMSVLGDDAGSDNVEVPAPTPPVVPAPDPIVPVSPGKDLLRCTGGTVNVRKGDDTSYDILTRVSRGDILTPVYDESGSILYGSNGWSPIRILDTIGWISGKYTEKVPAKVEPPIDYSRLSIVDLSQHNDLKSSKNDWSLLAKNVSMVILRCGVTRKTTNPIGVGIDDHFEYAAQKCKEHGIPFGVYYYGNTYGSRSPLVCASEEAKKTYEIASKYNPLFYVYDLEETVLTNESAILYKDTLRKLVGAEKKIGLYVGHHLYPNYVAATEAYDFLWIPRYGKNTGQYDPQYAPIYVCDLHQYTSVGTVPGIEDKSVDLNRITARSGWMMTEDAFIPHIRCA